jgi:hypothetical protein
VTRRILWFATAYTIVIIVHEAAHAFAANAVGLNAELFHFWANIDPTNQASAFQRAAFGSAGPCSSLVLGVAAWLVYRRVPRTRAGLPLVFLAASGVSNFFGNLMSAAFVGDFSNVARWLNLPMTARYAMSATGAIVTALVLFAAGRQLARWTKPGSRLSVAATAVLVPAAIGTGLIILINQPVPLPGFAGARLGEGAVWIFAAAGAFTAGPAPAPDESSLRLNRYDIAIAVIVIGIVRVLTRGIWMPG